MTIFPVIDTNILINGLRFRRSPEEMLLEVMMTRDIEYVASRTLIDEYEWALTNPRLMQRHHIPLGRAKEVLAMVTQNACIAPSFSQTKLTPVCRDPGDQFLWNLLDHRSDLILITLDKLLLSDRAMQHRIVSPELFLDPHHKLQWNGESPDAARKMSGNRHSFKAEPPELDGIIDRLQSTQKTLRLNRSIPSTQHASQSYRGN